MSASWKVKFFFLRILGYALTSWEGDESLSLPLRGLIKIMRDVARDLHSVGGLRVRVVCILRDRISECVC